MKPTRNPFIVGTAIAALFLSYTGAHAAGVWDGGGEATPTTPGNFDTALNWDNDLVPSAINTNVSNGGTILVTTNHTTNDILAATNASSTGTWTQSAGIITMGGGWFRLGTAAGASGTYNLSGGTLNTVGQINIGEASGTTTGNSAVNVSGTGIWNNTGLQITVGGQANGGGGVGRGTLSLSGSGTITNSSELWVGENSGSVGVFNMSGGTFTANNWVAVGRNSATGTFNMSGGTLNKNATGNITLAGIGTAQTATVNMTGGTINNTASGTWVGETATAVVNIDNSVGTSLANLGAVTLGNNTGANGTVNLNGGTFAANTIVKGSGTGTFNLNGGVLRANATGGTLMTGLTRANVRNGGAFVDTQANITTIAQALLHSNIGGDLATDGGLTKQGNGNLILSGANTFTGDTVLSAGTLTTANATALGGSTLNYNNQGGTLSFGTLTATTFGGLRGAQNLALTNLTPANVTLTVGANNANTTYTGILSGGGALTKNGTGSLTLTNANTFGGNVTVFAGSLVVTNSSALGSTAKTIDVGQSNGTAGNTQLRLNGSGGDVNLPATFTYSTSNTAGTIFNDAGNNSIAGQINMTAGGGGTTIQSDVGSLSILANITPVTTGRVLTLQGASSGAISGTISDGSTLGLPVIKNGAGTWILSGPNSYTGATTVNVGVLQAGVAGTAFGTNSPVTLANAAGAVLNLNGFSNTIGSLNGGGAAGGNVSLGAGTLTTGGLSTAATYSGVISGTGGLTKTGTETLTLANPQTFTGATTISDGTLALDHSGVNLGALGESAVNIGASGTLKAKGNAIIGSTTAATLASSGTVTLQDLNINTLTLGGGASLTGSTINLDLGNGLVDEIITNDAAIVSGTNTINLGLLTGQAVNTGNYTLITATAGLGSAGFTIGAKPVGFYTYSLAPSTATSVILNISGNASPSIAYWTGLGSAGESDFPNNWAAGSTIPKSNWSTTVAGTSDPLQVPGAVTDVYFSAANAASISGDLLTTLDASYSINSLTFDTSPQTTDPISSVTIDPNGNTLTLGTAGLTVGTSDNSSTTIVGSGGISLLGSQFWANNSNQPLTIGVPISGFTGVTTLTLSGTGTGGVALGGVIGNGTATSVGLVLNQVGETDLNSSNTFTGGVLLSSGTVVVGNAGAFNSTTPNTVTFGPGSTTDLRLNGFNVTVASLSTDAVVGTPVIENSSGIAATLTDNIATGNSTYAGLLQDGSGGGTLSLTKAGAGTLALTTQNTYSGVTNVNAGYLNLGSAENAGVSGPIGKATAAGSITFGGGILQYSAANQFDYSSRFSTAAAQQYKIGTNGQNVTLATNLTSTGASNIQKFGNGTLNLTGTTYTVGNVFGHGGTLLLNPNAIVTTTGYCSIGQATGDSSTVSVTGSSQLVVTGDFNVSDLTGTNAVLNIADTAAVKGSTLYLGKLGNATGVINQTGGSFAPNAAAADWRIGGAFSAVDSASVGIYNLAGGTFTTANNFQVGAFGSGSLRISGTGAATVTGGFPSIGRYVGGYGVLDISGTGAYTFTAAANRLIIGEEGTGVLNVRGGSVTDLSTSTTAGLTLGNNATGNATANLLGGTLTVSSVGKVNAGATGLFNFNGGILKANAASTTFLTGLNAAYVYGGGANIDADGKAITIGQALLTPAGSSGLASVTVTNGGSGYTTAPIVRISGDGTGATAVATIVGGAIDSIIVTNPGTGYTTASFTLVNGLSGGSGAVLTPNLAANVSGPLNVSSTTAGGVVTLTGANTFSGDTTIAAGATLQLGNGTTGNDGTILSATITDNGTLIYNRFGTASYGGPITGTGGVTKSGAGTQTLSGVNSYTGVTTVNGGTLSVADIENGGVNSNIGASTAASTNLVFGGNGTLLYTGPNVVTDRGYTVGTGGGIDHANNVTFGGQILSTATGSFTKNGTGTLSFTNTTGTNNLTGGGTGNGLGFMVNAGLVNLGGTPGSPLAQTNIITGEVSLGTINSGSSPAAEIDINGGTTTITSYIGVGRGNGTNNAATTLTLNNNAVVSSGNFAIGYSNGVAGYTSSPSVNFNGTSSYTDTGVFTVGESNNGVGGISTINVNGTASVALTSLTATAVNIGAGGSAIMNQNGGSVTTAVKVTIARDATSTATYYLNGGTLTALSVVNGAGTGTFNFNGGTLTATADSATFLQGLTRANVRNGGAIINSGTFTLTAPQALVHSDVGGDAAADGGLTKQGSGTLTMTLANSYTGNTTVSGGTLELQANNSLSDTANVNLATGTTLKLNFAGTDTVSRLFLNGVEQAPGVWGRIGSGAAHETAYITSDGLLQVTNGTAATPFTTWAETTHGLTGADALPAADPDADGYNNLAEFILGGEPNPANPGAGSNQLAPTVAVSGGNHVFSFRRSQLSTTQSGLVIGYEYGSNLTGWTAAPSVPDGVTVSSPFTDFYGSGIDKVEVTIPDSLGPVGVRFARMHATMP